MCPVSAQGSGFTWTRRIVVATVVVVLSLSGHAAGSSMLPNLPGLLVALSLTCALTVTVDPRTTPLRMFAFLLGMEVLLHAVFVVSSDHHVGSGASTLVPSAASVLGHVSAAAIAMVVLRHGDRVLLSWSALLAAVFGAPCVDLPALAARPVPVAGPWDARTVGADAPFSSHSRRGPPVV